MTWHVPESTMATYVTGRIGDADAWSVEAHLVQCERCRRQAGVLAADGTDAAELVERARAALPTPLPRQGKVRRAGRFRSVVVLAASGPAARGAWLLSMLIVLAASVVLDLGNAHVGAVGEPGGVPWLTLLAPVIPVVGVAAAYDSGLDDAHEIIAATPSGGLRLLLLRTLAVLAATVPASLAVGLWTSGGSPVGWLLPALALTSLTLALGSLTGIGPAAIVIGVAWGMGVAGPALVGQVMPRILATDAAPAWAAVAVLSAVAVVFRAESFSRLPSRARAESEV